MNKLLKRLSLAGVAVVMVFGMTTISGCGKNKPCKAVITVVSASTGAPIAGAQLLLQPPSTATSGTPIQPMTGSTDASGVANFETPLPKILDIIVNNWASGKVVRFEEGKTDNVTVQY
ncbi:MAG TPA: hypothetical protein VFU15_09070 [Bacteroidia bacterium]|nr:hypothetical protein [Bacteroidia bacterium]